MKNTRLKVALIYGGRGYEHDISKRGAEFMFTLIDRAIYDVVRVYITRGGRWLIEENPNREAALSIGGFLSHGEFMRIDCAIPLLHGDFGEDGTVQGALINAQIPYVGCDVVCSACATDKAYTNAVAQSLGIPTKKWVLCTDAQTSDDARLLAEQTLGYPMFIKPARLGSSFGASAAPDSNNFERAYNLAKSVSKRILIEEHINISSELECAYFSAKSKQIFTNTGEIRYNTGFYDYESKYSESSKAEVCEQSFISRETEEKVREYSKQLCHVLGARHLARVDFFLSKDGDVVFNEMNTFPGFTSASLYPRLIERAGIPALEAVNLWIEDSIHNPRESFS